MEKSHQEKDSPQQKDHDDISDAASNRSEQQSLRDETLPSYSDPVAGSSQRNQAGLQHAATDNNAGPTTASPFNFPTDVDLPSYPNVTHAEKPLAVPQTWPGPDAPFILAYPTQLLHYGITTKSWYNFVSTLSDFLSAKVSSQAVHHATDIANIIGTYHKRYAKKVKQDFKNIGTSAKQLNPFGVVGGAIGVTMGSVGHVVGSVFNVQGSIVSKPQRPRERAETYLAAANKDWFHERQLHAFLADTNELARTLGTSAGEFLARVPVSEDANPSSRLSSLREYIGELEVKQKDDETRESPSVSTTNISADSKKAGKRPLTPGLQLDASTLWLVVIQSKETGARDINEKSS